MTTIREERASREAKRIPASIWAPAIVISVLLVVAALTMRVENNLLWTVQSWQYSSTLLANQRIDRMDLGCYEDSTKWILSGHNEVGTMNNYPYNDIAWPLSANEMCKVFNSSADTLYFNHIAVAPSESTWLLAGDYKVWKNGDSFDKNPRWKLHIFY